ncbi:uncharacterized protein MELLADRAFT_56975 [Melampsora larici-populina 98AG31]|uniref:No apical meristem-associated C-terminal domain-containing protein n=1 Tax=Melampsora larici-populina (strain 98AG31 / pathotype 3-4-7) TaxID=747676 RepID=F4RWV3_MELLP|nr:uncharacterized protein MELLADRAFT_56975 [Melampsora larici-populina 98AG31]EGG03090.1 hypothetical protein MELLADRAFT_56975 [Melampsora larici-populina 98AG31]
MGTNQTGDGFFQRVTNHLESISSFTKRDMKSVKVKWSALKTATIKFSGIMAQIEHSPPSGTVQTDWPELAIKIYNESNARAHFKSLAAWRILSAAPKWIVPRPPPGPLAMSISSASNPLSDASGGPSSDSALDSGVNTPRALTPPRPTGMKKTKRQRLQDEKAEAIEDRQDQLKRANELAERRVKALEEGTELTKKMALKDAEAKDSLVQVNDLKVLMMKEENCHTELAKETLKLMQQRLKEKYSSEASSSN